MNSRAYQFQLQAAEAAAAAAPVVHAAEGREPEVAPKAPLLMIQAAQGTAADEPASRQGSGLAPTMTMGTIGNAEATATKCPECPKWFGSEKAMFGHLRKHPERGYKGATRPTATMASAAAAAAVAGDKKPTKKVPRKQTAGVPAAINMAAAAATKAWEEAELSTKWPASVKRGRTPVAPVQASSCSEEEEAAMILLELASSSRTSSETQQQQQSVDPVRAPDAVSGHQMQMSVVEEPMLLDHPAEAEQQIVQLENALELSAETQTAPAVKQVTDLAINTEALLIGVPANMPIVFPGLDSGAGDKKATKKQRRVTNPEQMAASTPPPPEGAVVVLTPPPRRIPSPASDKKHTCPTCGKSFPTHQALGGHMASHVKGAKTTSAQHEDLAAAQAKRNIAELAHRNQSAGNSNGTIPAVSAGAVAGVLQELQDAQLPPPQAPTPKPTPMPQTAAPHVCDECHLIFPSGQALGGHKRKHWFPEKQQAKAASASAPAPALAPRDFDLNEMPEEGQGENKNQP